MKSDGGEGRGVGSGVGGRGVKGRGEVSTAITIITIIVVIIMLFHRQRRESLGVDTHPAQTALHNRVNITKIPKRLFALPLSAIIQSIATDRNHSGTSDNVVTIISKMFYKAP